MASPAARLPAPFVTVVRSRTVANVDSMGTSLIFGDFRAQGRCALPAAARSRPAGQEEDRHRMGRPEVVFLRGVLPQTVLGLCYSQSFFLKTTYRLVHTTAISTTANGYPPAQCSSGMWSKFMP